MFGRLPEKPGNNVSNVGIKFLKKYRRSSLTGFMEENYKTINDYKKYPDKYIITRKINALLIKLFNNTITPDEFTLLEELNKIAPDIYISEYNSLKSSTNSLTNSLTNSSTNSSTIPGMWASAPKSTPKSPPPVRKTIMSTRKRK